MKLEELRRIASERTKGKWNTPDNDDYDSAINCGQSMICLDIGPENAKFCAAFANHIDALLDLAEVAKHNSEQHLRTALEHGSAECNCSTCRAIARLESIK